MNFLIPKSKSKFITLSLTSASSQFPAIAQAQKLSNHCLIFPTPTNLHNQSEGKQRSSPSSMFQTSHQFFTPPLIGEVILNNCSGDIHLTFSSSLQYPYYTEI